MTDNQEYAMSGQETHDQQEAAHLAEVAQLEREHQIKLNKLRLDYQKQTGYATVHYALQGDELDPMRRLLNRLHNAWMDYDSAATDHEACVEAELYTHMKPPYYESNSYHEMQIAAVEWANATRDVLQTGLNPDPTHEWHRFFNQKGDTDE